MKLAAFDLEIAKDLSEKDDWRQAGALGITCAAIACSDRPAPSFWQGIPQLTQDESQRLVRNLTELVKAGYTLVTWNGCSFDFAVLAQESGLWAECAELAMHHVDLMLIVTFTKGWYLGLQKALKGAGLEGKLKSVTLANGSILDDMDGGQAPRLWATGEYEAVLKYLEYDVVQLLQLTQWVLKRKAICWTSTRGNPLSVEVPQLLTVQQCHDIPAPDVSWMESPPTRQQFTDWMPTA